MMHSDCSFICVVTVFNAVSIVLFLILHSSFIYGWNIPKNKLGCVINFRKGYFKLFQAGPLISAVVRTEMEGSNILICNPTKQLKQEQFLN